MPQSKSSQMLSELRRKEIFKALVEAQDQKMGVEKSRELIVEQFGVSEQQVREIEEEGLAREWPPL